MKFRILPPSILKLMIVTTLAVSPVARAQSNGNANGGGNGGTNNGNPGCQNNCPGNNGSGVGNTAPGNQGNNGSNGNAGSVTGSSTGGGTTGTTTGSSTGGLNGGNNGNGVGNTGPGNQGNDTTNGNAGGTTGSTNGGTTGSTNGNSNGNAQGGGSTGNGNGGTTTGATAGGSTGGGETGSSTGGFNGGNNGNGVGNTGPGNQGNDTDNGNAGGTTGSTNGGTTGSTNGNSNGNAQGGSTGNAQGNAQGGSTGNAQGNAQGGSTGNAQGNAQGGSTGNAQGNSQGGTDGSSAGGSSTGGETVGSSEGGFTGGGTVGNSTGGTDGSSAGGSSTGGETVGSSTGGTEGSSTGGTEGSSTGGTEGSSTGGTEGSSTGGTEGSSTGGTEGSSTGGTEGSSTGGESTGETDGGSTGGETTGDVEQVDTQPERKLKARLLPLAFGNYDILTKAVNLTLHPQSDLKSNDGEIAVMLDDYRTGFQVSQIRSWNLGLGVAPQVYMTNASGLAALTTGLAGLAVTKNRFIQYERLVKEEAELASLNVLPLPFTKKVVDRYAKGESVYFENMGGVMFMGGAGVAGAFAGGSMVSEGGWKTMVSKTDSEKVVVQIAKAKINSTSLFTGLAVLSVDSTKVKQLNQGFTYEFDFAIGGSRAVEAYEAMLSGNMTIAQELAQTSAFTGVTPVNAYTQRDVTRRRGGTIGIPMVAIYNWASGRVYGEQATLTYADKTTTDMNYGVFFKEQKGRFFHKHKRLLRSFYSGVAVTKNEAQKVVGIEEKASFLWSYETDNGSSAKLNDAVAMFHRDLGVKKAFTPAIENGKKLNYVRLEAKLDIPAAFTGKIIAAMRSERSLEGLRARAEDMINDYVDQGDESDLCTNDETEMLDSDDACRRRLISDTRSSLTRIRATLLTLNDKDDAADYTATYAMMGKELIRNQFVLNSVFSYDDKCELKYELKLDGRRLNKMVKMVPANISCR